MIFDHSRKEFIAKLVADLGKTIFAVGLASYLFEKFPFGVRIFLLITCVGLLVGCVIIQPKQK